MKFFGIILLLALLFLIISNPSETAHKARLNGQLTKDHPILSALGLGRMVTPEIVYHNYLVFSTADLGGELVSLGFAGEVYCAKDRR